MVKIYGIKNCDTMKKAFTWLNKNNVAYEFHDYKKQGADQDILKQAISQHGWESVINRRGTTWRKLPDNIRNGMDAAAALNIANENPSIIKRPLLVKADTIYLGFDDQSYNDNLLGD